MSRLKSRGIASIAMVIGSAALLATALTGCSGNPVSTPTPTTSQSPLTDAQALVKFAAIVDASIAKANGSGLTQTTVGSMTGTYLLVADKAGSQYQATEKNPDGSYELLFEADAFVPAAAKTFLQLGATVSMFGEEFHLTRIIEGAPTTYVYKVADGLLVSKLEQNVESSALSTLQYEVTADGLATLMMGETLSKP